MQQTQPTILAINPGTKYLAVALFQGNQLKDWRIKTLKGKWSEEKLKKAFAIISGLIERFKPDTLCLKRIHHSRSSPALNSLVAEIQKLALTEHFWLYRYSVKELEAYLCDKGKRNKKNLAEAVAANYPELYSELHTEYPELLDPEKERKNPYHVKMFEAVALGAVCIKNQRGNNQINQGDRKPFPSPQTRI